MNYQTLATSFETIRDMAIDAMNKVEELSICEDVTERGYGFASGKRMALIDAYAIITNKNFCEATEELESYRKSK